MELAFTILGEPASKANSRKLVTIANRPAVIKSEKARKYSANAQRQIPPKCRVRLEGPVVVELRIFYMSERPDLDESVLLDAMQDQYARNESGRYLVQAGVYRNDRQVREKHVYHAIDKGQPRAEVVVRQMP